jgi:hypothetical protein
MHGYWTLKVLPGTSDRKQTLIFVTGLLFKYRQKITISADSKCIFLVIYPHRVILKDNPQHSLIILYSALQWCFKFWA